MTPEQIKEMAKKELSHYIQSALWSTGDDKNSSYEEFEASSEMKKLSLIDLTYFIAHNYCYLKDAREGQIGYNLWLSRNGHGAGFFDSELDYSDLLQKRAEALGVVDLFVNDKNKIEIS